MAFPMTVTFTGSLGAGMTATIVQNIGSKKGTTTTFEQLSHGGGIPSATDVQRYRVAGVPTSYDAGLALMAAGLGYGSTHPYIRDIACFEMSMEKSSKEGYVMNCSFKRPPLGEFPPGTVLPTMIGVSFTQMEIPADMDTFGNTVVNSAGDPFNPPQNLTIFLVRIKLMRWQTQYSLATARSLVGKVNHDDIVLEVTGTTAVPARCLRLLNWAPAQEIYIAATLIPVLYELEYRGSEPVEGRAGGYDRKLIDKGYRAWYTAKNVSLEGVASAGETLRGKISEKVSLQTTPEPVLLDGTGRPLFPKDFTVVDQKNGFYDWDVSPAGTLPVESGEPRAPYPGDYVFPTASPSGPWFLPYRIEREASFQPLVDAGL